MSNTVGLHVHFFLDGKRYATRRWLFAPSAGDEVMLGPDEERQCYKIIRMVWGNDMKTRLSTHQLVNCEIKLVEQDTTS